VVMLRDVGVPARVATGYATSNYDRVNARYEVDDSDAHAWVQVYFPNVGWLDFEPTPINPELVRPDTSVPDIAAVPAVIQRAPAAPATRLPVDPRAIAVAVLALLATLIGVTIRRQWEAELSPQAYVRLVYGRMVRRSGRFGLRKQAEETALEFGYRLADHFELTAEPLAQAARQLATLYVLAQYAGAPPLWVQPNAPAPAKPGSYSASNSGDSAAARPSSAPLPAAPGLPSAPSGG